jgi:dTDP-4-dehydrorhamnose 3,5-epimerase
VLSEDAVFQYKCDEFYHPEAEGAIAWDDKDIAIEWPIPAEDIILSEKDKHHPGFNVFISPFNV